MGEYVPSNYSNILTRMLEHGAQVGQGGHLEGDTEDVTQAITRLDASMYSFLAAGIADTLGMDRADPLLRDAVIGFGRYRGNDMRREVERRAPAARRTASPGLLGPSRVGRVLGDAASRPITAL